MFDTVPCPLSYSSGQGVFGFIVHFALLVHLLVLDLYSPAARRQGLCLADVLRKGYTAG
jgi:hypothetical protein